MKLCPNPACPHVVRRRYPSEYLDHAVECSDCAMPLVDAAAYGTAETQRAVTEWHETREKNAAIVPTSGGTRRLDVATGSLLVVLGVIVIAAGHFSLLAVGALAYGGLRLARGLTSKKAPKRAKRATDPYRESSDRR